MTSDCKIHTYTCTPTHTHTYSPKVRESGCPMPMTRNNKKEHSHTVIHIRIHRSAAKINVIAMPRWQAKGEKAQIHKHTHKHIHKAAAEMNEIAVPRRQWIKKGHKHNGTCTHTHTNAVARDTSYVWHDQTCCLWVRWLVGWLVQNILVRAQ